MAGEAPTGEPTMTAEAGPGSGTRQMFPESIELFYDESKAQADGLWETMKAYRANATATLALATGAATFFGLADTAKGPLYWGALAFYVVAVLLVMSIYMPTDWVPGAAPELGDALRDTPAGLGVDQARYSLARLNVERYQTNLEVIKDVSWRFRLLLMATGLVLLCAAANTLVEKPATPDEPTRIVIEKGAVMPEPSSSETEPDEGAPVTVPIDVDTPIIKRPPKVPQGPAGRALFERPKNFQ